jgi:hypothetical protein
MCQMTGPFLARSTDGEQRRSHRRRAMDDHGQIDEPLRADVFLLCASCGNRRHTTSTSPLGLQHPCTNVNSAGVRTSRSRDSSGPLEGRGVRQLLVPNGCCPPFHLTQAASGS